MTNRLVANFSIAQAFDELKQICSNLFQVYPSYLIEYRAVYDVGIGYFLSAVKIFILLIIADILLRLFFASSIATILFATSINGSNIIANNCILIQFRFIWDIVMYICSIIYIVLSNLWNFLLYILTYPGQGVLFVFLCAKIVNYFN
jgi:hypothetical protein